MKRMEYTANNTPEYRECCEKGRTAMSIVKSKNVGAGQRRASTFFSFNHQFIQPA
ncbi:MAG: hypothetical protein R3C41_16845 [Calditrichia bacterium]